MFARLREMLDRWSTHSFAERVDKTGVPALQAILTSYLDVCDRAPNRIRAYYALLREADGPVPAKGLTPCCRTMR